MKSVHVAHEVNVGLMVEVGAGLEQSAAVMLLELAEAPVLPSGGMSRKTAFG